MKFTNNFGLPQNVVDVLTHGDFDPRKLGENRFWATKLIQPPKVVVLERDHWDEIEVDVSDSFARTVGTALHELVERRQDDSDLLTEERGYLNMETFDVITPKRGERLEDVEGYDPETIYVSVKLDCYKQLSDTEGVISDHKLTTKWAVLIDGKLKPDQVAQLNIYAFAMRRLGFPVTRLYDVLWLKDWSKSEASKRGDYPKCPIVTLDAPLWSEDKCKEYLMERVRVHVSALNTEDENDIPHCTFEERWAKKPVYAVMRTGRKTSLKNHDSEAAANAHAESLGKGHYVETRPGSNVRCEGYCNVRQWCNFWKESGK